MGRAGSTSDVRRTISHERCVPVLCTGQQINQPSFFAKSRAWAQVAPRKGLGLPTPETLVFAGIFGPPGRSLCTGLVCRKQAFAHDRSRTKTAAHSAFLSNHPTVPQAILWVSPLRLRQLTLRLQHGMSSLTRLAFSRRHAPTARSGSRGGLPLATEVYRSNRRRHRDRPDTA